MDRPIIPNFGLDRPRRTLDYPLVILLLLVVVVASML